jgi:hypothetical protein
MATLAGVYKQCGRERPFATYSLSEVFQENSVYNFLGYEEYF